MSIDTEPDHQTYGTVTVLTFATPADRQAAVSGLANLIRTARDLPGFLDCWVLATAETQSVMVTLYTSQAAAEQASTSLRPELGVAVGSHVTGPPQRWAGRVVAGGDERRG